MSPNLSNCDLNELPLINFNKDTLIGYVSSVAGFSMLEVSYEVIGTGNSYL